MRIALLGRPFPEVSVGDVEKEFGRNAFDVVVTNLPWGVRTAKAEDFAKLYRRFCWYVGLVVTPGGCAVCLTVQWRLLLELARSSGLWEVAGVHAVRTGDLVQLLQDEPTPADIVPIGASTSMGTVRRSG